MSVLINSVTIGGVEDRRFELTNSQVARVINVGTSWNTIRIGIRFSFSDLGVSLAGTPRLYIGMLSNPSAGMANGPLGITTSHFVGYISAVAGWTRSATGGIWYTSITSTNAWAKKVGNTITTVAGSGTNLGFPGDPSLRRNLMIVELVKGSPNFTINACGPSGGAIAGDVPNKSTLLAAMENATLGGAATFLNSVILTGSYIGSMTGNPPVNEGVDGALNAVCVAWNRSDPIMYISDIAWARMA